MSGQRKLLQANRRTGTVPKVNHCNNSVTNNHDDDGRYSMVLLSNNLGRETDQQLWPYRNQTRNTPSMDLSTEQIQSITTNGTSTPNTSRTHSRRNSIGTVPKCENVSKYPDKRQIETKLSQIREYLRVTSSLMTNMKCTDEQPNEDAHAEQDQLQQMINDLKDSEAKLKLMLLEMNVDDSKNNEVFENGPELEASASGLNKNELEQKVEAATREMHLLKEQENLLLHLQLNAESQMREARVAQEKLMKGSKHSRNTNTEGEGFLNGYHDASSSDAVSNSSKNFNENQVDVEERKILLQDRCQSQIDILQNRILQLREGNDNRNHLIHILDNRDAALQAEHSALHGKLMELQTKKMQVDQLVLQLQNMNEESEDEEMGNQVKRIVTMKEQLAKLKDMLNVVQDTENVITGPDVEDHMRRLCSKTDNLIQNDMRLNRSHSTDVNNGRTEYNSSSSNEQRVKEKHVNKKSMNANERERIKLQAELQAKKRELEELMCKHKAATSNLNHDVSSENKSELSHNPLFDVASNSWFPVPTNIYNLPQNQQYQQYSSDECPDDEINDFSEITSSAGAAPVQPMPSLNYPTSNYTKREQERQNSADMSSDLFLNSASTRTPERSVHNVKGSREPRDASDGSKRQMQKQLELIKTVCDSMLDHQSAVNNPPNVQVRNNLTPSPIYSEPGRYASPSGNAFNALNLVNSAPMDAFAGGVPPLAQGDASHYQHWMAANTLQTQTFMLNTLNQCCQMLWLQQRELIALRNSMNVMQDQRAVAQPAPFEPTPPMPQYLNSTPACLFPPTPNLPLPNNHQFRHHPNQVKPSVVGAASLPNLSHAHCPQTNNEQHACLNYCNRILDTALNNNHSAVHNQHNDEHANNSVLHSVNQSHIWNGQALNNQVAPGNRANNYWDNFRSYSRQNLLQSTKSNDGLQNIERTNNSLERPTTSQQTPNVPKLNTDVQETGAGAAATPSSQSNDNTPRRVRMKASRRESSSSIAGAIPPDVLNVNQPHQVKTNENLYLLDFNLGENSNRVTVPFDDFEETTPKEQPTGTRRNRNEWHDDMHSENIESPKSKLFEELRENVYKEVASLISANQGRPHFLIQLFRDLQLVSSDPLRRRTLQSIQSLITNSIAVPGNVTGGAMRQVPNIRDSGDELLEANHSTTTDFFELPPFMWHQLPKTLRNEMEMIDSNGQEHLSEVFTFLNNHNEDIFSDSLVHALRDTLVESTFSTIFTNSNSKDGIIQKHFASLLTEALEQYRGKKVQDVRLNVLQTVEELLRGEISLIRLMRENISEGELNLEPPFELQVPLVMEEASIPQMQNGDLAEADQSRIDIGEEDEGAVGGVLNILLERSSSSNAGQVIPEETELPKLDLIINNEPDVEFVEQGLDQVPTRLTTRPLTRSNTPPNKSPDY